MENNFHHSGRGQQFGQGNDFERNVSQNSQQGSNLKRAIGQLYGQYKTRNVAGQSQQGREMLVQQSGVWPRHPSQSLQSYVWPMGNTPQFQQEDPWSRNTTSPSVAGQSNVSQIDRQKPLFTDYHSQAKSVSGSQRNFQQVDSGNYDKKFTNSSTNYSLDLTEHLSARSAMTNTYDRAAPEDSRFDNSMFRKPLPQKFKTPTSDQELANTNTSRLAGHGNTMSPSDEFGRNFTRNSPSFQQVQADTNRSLSSQQNTMHNSVSSHPGQFAKAPENDLKSSQFSAPYRRDPHLRPREESTLNSSQSVTCENRVSQSVETRTHSAASADEPVAGAVTNKSQAVSFPPHVHTAVKNDSEAMNQTCAGKESQTKTAISKSGDQNKSDSSASAAEVHCDVCDLSFPNQKSYVRHSVGILHLNRLEEKKSNMNKEILEPPKVETSEVTKSETQKNNILDAARRCEQCRVTCTSWSTWKVHVNSPQHRKNRAVENKQEKIDEILKRAKSYLDHRNQKQAQQEQKKLGETYKCDACNMFFNGPKTYSDHLRQLSHLSKVNELNERSGKRPGGILKKTNTYFVSGGHLKEKSLTKNDGKSESTKEENVIDKVKAIRESYKKTRKEQGREATITKEEKKESCSLCSVSYDGAQEKEMHNDSSRHAWRYKVMMDLLGKETFSQRYPGVSEGKKAAPLKDDHKKTDEGGKLDSKTSTTADKGHDDKKRDRGMKSKSQQMAEVKYKKENKLGGVEYDGVQGKDMHINSFTHSLDANAVDKASVFTQGQKLQAAWTIVDEVNASSKDKDKIRAYVLMQIREKPNLEITELKKIALDFMKANAMKEEKPSDVQFEYFFECLLTGVFMDAKDKERIKGLLKVHYEKAQNMSLESMASYARTYTVHQKSTKEEKDKLVSLLHQNLLIAQPLVDMVELKVGLDMKNEMYSFLTEKIEKGQSSTLLMTQAEKHLQKLTWIRENKISQNLQRSNMGDEKMEKGYETHKQLSMKEKRELFRNDTKQGSSKPAINYHTYRGHHPGPFHGRTDTFQSMSGSSFVQPQPFKNSSREKPEEGDDLCTTSRLSENKLIHFIQGVVQRLPVEADEKDLIFRRLMSEVRREGDMPLEHIGHLALRFMESVVDERQSFELQANRKRTYQGLAYSEEYKIEEKRFVVDEPNDLSGIMESEEAMTTHTVSEEYKIKEERIVGGDEPNDVSDIMESEEEMIRLIMEMSDVDDPEIAREALAVAGGSSQIFSTSLEASPSADTHFRPPVDDLSHRTTCEDDEIMGLMENFLSNTDMIHQLQRQSGIDDPSFIKYTIEKCFRNPRIRRMLGNLEDFGDGFVEILLQVLLNPHSDSHNTTPDANLQQADKKSAVNAFENKQLMSDFEDFRVQEKPGTLVGIGGVIINRSRNHMGRGGVQRNQHVNMSSENSRNLFDTHNNSRNQDYRESGQNFMGQLKRRGRSRSPLHRNRRRAQRSRGAWS